MKTRFFYELIIAIIGILAVLIFGQKGGAVLALIALQPLLFKREFDDEDKILFKKVNIYTLIPLCALLIPMFIFFNQKINGNIIKDLSIWLAGFIFLFSHGIMGLIFFINKKK
jgi:hypothetical protein